MRNGNCDRRSDVWRAACGCGTGDRDLRTCVAVDAARFRIQGCKSSKALKRLFIQKKPRKQRVSRLFAWRRRRAERCQSTSGKSSMLSLRNIVDPRRTSTPGVCGIQHNHKMAEKEGFDSRLRARSGPALTLHWSVIHSRPFESLQALCTKKHPVKLDACGGEGGIRTLETLLTPTRFPVVRLLFLSRTELLFDRRERKYLPSLYTVHAP